MGFETHGVVVVVADPELLPQKATCDACCSSFVASKRLFLECYHLARSELLVEARIKAGWIASGLWPFNVVNPFISGLLFKNCNESTTPKVTSRDSELRTFQSLS